MRYNNYLDENCEYWHVADFDNIYSCDCDHNPPCDMHEGSYYPRNTVWFVKIRNILTGELTYMTTKYATSYPVNSFEEIFDSISVPQGYELYDEKHLYICRED